MNLREQLKTSNELVKQVMMQDIQRRSFKRLMKSFETNNMLFLVLHLNNYLAKDKTPQRIQKHLKKYFRDVDNQVFSLKSNKQLQRYVVIENLKKQKFQINNRLVNRTHIQVAIECPNHLNKFKLRDILRNSLNNQICNLEHIETVDRYKHIDNYDELIDYNTKDIQSVKPQQTDITFDEVNSYKRVH